MEFRNIIENLLRFGRIDEKYIKYLVGNDEMLLYKNSLIDESADEFEQTNKESDKFQFIGHTLVDSCTLEYIRKKYKNITHFTGTRIKHYIQQRNIFEKYIKELNLEKYIKFGGIIQESLLLKEQDKTKNTKYIKLLNQSFKSLMGCIYYITEKNIDRSVAYQLVFNIISRIYSLLKIEITYDFLIDSKTRLKDLIEENYGKNTFLKYYKVRVIDTNNLEGMKKMTQVIISLPNGKILHKHEGFNKKVIEQEAAEEALQKFKKLGIKTRPKYLFKKAKDFAQPTPEFIFFIKNILKGIISPQDIKEILTKENLTIFKQAFTHKDVNSNANYEILEFYGDNIANTCINQYILNRFPRIINKKYYTRLKQMLVSTTYFSAIADKYKFINHISYNYNKIQGIEYDKMLEDVFEAFFGALITSITNIGYKQGVAFNVCYSIIRKWYDNIVIKIGWFDIYDSKSTLKELYESPELRWKYKENEILIFNKKKGNRYFAEIYGYPNIKQIDKGDGMMGIPDDAQQTLIAEYNNPDPKISLEGAAKKALWVLKTKYNISFKPPSPYV